MTENLSFSPPIEYMLAATFSGRVVFTSESLISYTGFDLAGRNLNEIFTDDVAAQLLYSCRSRGSFQDTVSFFGSRVTVNACTESDEIIIFVRTSYADRKFSPDTAPVNKVSRELDSSVAVLSMMLDNISAGDVNEETISLMNKQLMKLNRLSKNIAVYTHHLAREHYVNFRKISLNSFMTSLIDSIRVVVSGMPVELVLVLPEEEIFAMIDEEKIKRALLNVITNSIASRKESITITVTLYPVVSDLINIAVRDNGRGFSPTVISESFDATTLAGTYNSFGFAVSHIFLELHGGHFSVISEENKGTVVSISFPRNMDKMPPSFSSMIPPYSGNMDELLMELSPVLPPEKYIIKK
ncbi:MAG: sensor histidine kinase [Clostridia bacterium]|nr:sensor histidine kinase [Clostridia bacterium]